MRGTHLELVVQAGLAEVVTTGCADWLLQHALAQQAGHFAQGTLLLADLHADHQLHKLLRRVNLYMSCFDVWVTLT